MAGPSDQDSGEEPESSAAEPYPWRDSEPEQEAESASESEPESASTEPPQTEPPTDEGRARRDPSSHPRREQDTRKQRESEQNHSREQASRQPRPEAHSQEQTEPAGVKPAEERERRRQASDGSKDEKGLTARFVLLVFGGLTRIWHAKILGLHWILPRITGTTDSQAGLSGYFYPNDMIRQDERVKYAENPSRWLSPGPYVFSGLLLLISLVITIAVPLGYGEPLLDAATPAVLDLSVPNNWWYAPIFFTAVAVLLLLYVVMGRASTWHIVTDKRVLHRENVLAPSRSRHELIDINSIDCREPIPDRWFGVGYIDIYTASTGGKELVFAGVKDPSTIANGIDQLRHEYQEQIRAGSPEEGEREGEPQRERSHGEAQRHRAEDPGSERHPGNESPTSARDGRRPPEQERDAPKTARQDGKPREDPPNRREQPDGTADPFDQGGDSIEDQRPNHSLRDDIDDSFPGEDD